jgi:hypothetical protein
MGSPLLTVNATIMCSHGGQATFVPSNTRVKASGAFVATQACTTMIAGCPFTTFPAVPMPCVAAQWVVAATRVKVMGQPALTQSSTAMTTGTTPGLPLVIVQTQTRVTGT